MSCGEPEVVDGDTVCSRSATLFSVESRVQTGASASLSEPNDCFSNPKIGRKKGT